MPCVCVCVCMVVEKSLQVDHCSRGRQWSASSRPRRTLLLRRPTVGALSLHFLFFSLYHLTHPAASSFFFSHSLMYIEPNPSRTNFLTQLCAIICIHTQQGYTRWLDTHRVFTPKCSSRSTATFPHFLFFFLPTGRQKIKLCYCYILCMCIHYMRVLVQRLFRTRGKKN